jgi:hypothetical protein
MACAYSTAPTSGSGGCSIAFAVARSPAAVVTFPAPATSNAAGDILALRSPACFLPRIMRPIRRTRLSRLILRTYVPQRVRKREIPTVVQRLILDGAANALYYPVSIKFATYWVRLNRQQYLQPRQL